MRLFDRIFQGDRGIWMVAWILALISLLCVYSATSVVAIKDYGGNNTFVLMKHAVFVVAALVLMFGASRVKYTYYSNIFNLLFFVAIVLLILTQLFGTESDDARRSLSLSKILPFMGPNASFMPNEFVKIILIGFIARKIVLRKDNPDPGWKDICLNIMLPVIFVVGLIATENLSTAVLLFATCIAMMFVGKIKMKYILSFVGIAVLFLALFICIKFMTGSSGRQTTWKARITNTDNYQKDYAKAAIATGGIFGKLPGKSTERNSLPKVENDCIYAIVVEEYGLVGGVIVLSLYLILLYRVVMIMVKRPDSFGAILSFGLILCIVMQAFINMGVSVGLLPTTGQNLPFVSRGGTSMICTGISFGIILSVTRDINKNDEKRKELEQVQAAD